MDLSLDQLAKSVGISKRMLIHYFGSRESLEEQAMTLLEERLRDQFASQNFPTGVSLESVLHAALGSDRRTPARREFFCSSWISPEEHGMDQHEQRRSMKSNSIYGRNYFSNIFLIRLS